MPPSPYLLGVDFSENQPPNLPFRTWNEQDLSFCFGRVSIGYRRDSAYPRMLETAREAGFVCLGGYGVILHHDKEISFFDPIRQCDVFLAALIPGLITLCVIDIEVAGLTESMIRAWCDHFDAHSSLPLLLYGNTFLNGLLGSNPGRYAKYRKWVSDYGPFAPGTDAPPLRSEPFDLPGRPITPSVGGPMAIWQFAGDNGRRPPYAGAIDLNAFFGTQAELKELFGLATSPIPPSRVMPFFRPDTSRGSKIGLHTISPNRSRAIHGAITRRTRKKLAGVLSVENAGLLMEMEQDHPGTPKCWRLYTPQWDGCQDIEIWTEARIEAQAQEIADYARTRWDQLIDEERAAIDLIVLLNEADPPTVEGWGKYGSLWRLIVEKCAAFGLRVAGPAWNFGTPEWAEIIAFVEAGGTDALVIHGGALVIHEGVDPRTTDALKIDTGPISPDAPVVPGSGDKVCRYRYLLRYLRDTGRRCPPIIVGEFYGGGLVTDIPDQVVRFATYDDWVRDDPEIAFFAGFTTDPSGGWAGQDYTTAMDSEQMQDYIVAQADILNESEAELSESQRQRIEAQLARTEQGWATAAAAIDAEVGRAQATQADAHSAIREIMGEGLAWYAGISDGMLSPRIAAKPVRALIPMLRADGLATGSMRGNNFDLRERRTLGDGRALFRVIDQPINGNIWWVAGDDVTPINGALARMAAALNLLRG